MRIATILVAAALLVASAMAGTNPVNGTYELGSGCGVSAWGPPHRALAIGQ